MTIYTRQYEYYTRLLRVADEFESRTEKEMHVSMSLNCVMWFLLIASSHPIQKTHSMLLALTLTVCVCLCFIRKIVFVYIDWLLCTPKIVLNIRSCKYKTLSLCIISCKFIKIKEPKRSLYVRINEWTEQERERKKYTRQMNPCAHLALI